MREAASMIWWSWDEEAQAWRAATPAPGEAFDAGSHLRLVQVRAGRWALLARLNARVNGRPCLPLHILADRDEVAVAGGRFCISLQSQPALVSFRAGSRKVRCARCLDQLCESDQAVKCPRCGAHHHAPCWTYDTRCQKCEFPTDGTWWTPEAVA
jgi:hypothetical protein